MSNIPFCQNQKILYAEDEENTLMEMRIFLKRRFKQVILARNGEEALRKYEEFLPTIFITDLRLPGIGGLEVIKLFRERGFNGPVIITSALNDIETILQSVDLGISKYMIKPINTEELEEFLLNFTQRDLEKKFSDEEIKNHEDELAHLFSQFLKKNTGKGPQAVKVSLSYQVLEIRAYESLTSFETVILDHGRNVNIIEQNRRLFYQICKKRLEKLLLEQLEIPVYLKEIRIDSINRYDLLIFSFFV